MKNKSKALKNIEKEQGIGDCVRASAIGTVVCCMASVLLILVLGALSLCFEDPMSAARHGACAILFLSAFMCGCVSRIICHSYTLLCGVLSGLLFFLLTLALCFIYPFGESTVYSVLIRLALPLMSVLGAFASSYGKTKKRRRKR